MSVYKIYTHVSLASRYMHVWNFKRYLYTISQDFVHQSTELICLYVCMFVSYKNPSPDHSFDLIGMKLGLETPWDPGSDLE